MQTDEVKEAEKQTSEKDLSKVEKESQREEEPQPKRDSSTTKEVNKDAGTAKEEPKQASRKPCQDSSKVTVQEPKRQQVKEVVEEVSVKEKPLPSDESKGIDQGKTNTGKETTQQQKTGEVQKDKGDMEVAADDGEKLLEEALLKEDEEEDLQDFGEDMTEDMLLGNGNDNQEGMDAFDVDVKEAADLIDD